MIAYVLRSITLIVFFGLMDAYLVWGWWNEVARDLWPTLPVVTYAKALWTIIVLFTVWKALVIIALEENKS